MIDLTEPKHLEIEIRQDGKVVWIHIDGQTKMRCSRIENLIINDHRKDWKEEYATDAQTD